MNRVLVVVGAAIVLASPPARATEHEALREQSETVLDAGGVRRLEVSNARGLISVRRGAEGHIRLTALKIVTRGDRPHARELAAATVVRTSTDGGRLTVRVEYPQHRQIQIGFWDLFSGLDAPQVEVRLAFEVPPAMAVGLKSASGDLFTADLGGEQWLDSTSGDIEVGDAHAPVRVTTVSGDVTLTDIVRGRVTSVSGDVQAERVAGALQMGTTSGDINVRGAGDSLTVTSVSGEVQVEGARRALAVHTTSGDIEARGSGHFAIESTSGDATVSAEAPFAGAEVTTMSGDIRLHLGGELGCALQARTASGAIDLLVPLEVRSVTRQRVSGVVRHGTAPVVLRSSSGNVHVQN